MYDDSDQNRKNDHRNNRKVKGEIFPNDPDVSGQPAYPVEFIVEEINDEACKYYDNTNNDHIFTCIAVHCTKIL